MQNQVLIERLVNLLDDGDNIILNMSVEEAIERVGSGEPQKVREIDGQFALIHKSGKTIRMARSIGRPMRYFLAKKANGPILIVAERIDQIRDYLESEGIADQFHPTYTRMVPAHYITELALLGCPDPNPTYQRYLVSERDVLSTDVNEIGRAYIGSLANEISAFLDRIPKTEPIGVLFSGGIDSGAVLLTTYHLLLQRGENPSRLKAFTLSIDGGGSDVEQASQFLKSCDMDMMLETIEVSSDELNFGEAIEIIEDYKPLDVQSATMAVALLRGIRNRYPDWKYLLDGDGGDENLRDYPIEENSELTIRSVLNNPFFYHEGWGVDKVKHSLTYSGGQSRGHVRTYAPAAKFGFIGFSPFATPNVVGVAEGIPFIELTEWNHEKLYALKGEVCRRGVEQIAGITMPVFEKNRFQRGAVEGEKFAKIFPEGDLAYRHKFLEIFG